MRRRCENMQRTDVFMGRTHRRIFYKILKKLENNSPICTIWIDKDKIGWYSISRKQHKGVPYSFLFGMGMPDELNSVTVFDRD